MSNYEYQVRITKLSEKDGGGFIAIVPELPGCMSDGETYEEAVQNVKGAIDDWIKAAKFRGQEIPDPTPYIDEEEYSGRLVIRIPKKLHRELSENASEQNISLNQLILFYLSKQMGIEECEKKIKNKAEKNTKFIKQDEILKEPEVMKDINTTIRCYFAAVGCTDWGHYNFNQLAIANKLEGDD